MRKNRSSLVILLLLILVNTAFSEEFSLEKGDIPSLKRAFPSDPEKFTFAIIGDKTGGGEKNWHIFDRAVEEINLIKPDFAITIGDHIQGYTTDTAVMKTMWDEYFTHLSRLEMPALLVRGNHDMSTTAMYNYWKQKIGRTYYSFDYKGCHFLVINTEEHNAPEGAAATKAFADFAVSDLQKNKNARHIFIFMHRPLWVENKDTWKSVESVLTGSNYTVFAGHWHDLEQERRNDHTYMILSATGGGLDEIPDPELGLFHHYTLVTVEADKANIAIVKPGNILPETTSTIEFHERLEKSLVQLKAEMPIPQTGETSSGKLTFTLKNLVNKPIRIKISMSDINEALWKVSPKESIMESAPGEEKRSTFEFAYNFDSLSKPPKYTVETYYNDRLLYKLEQLIEFVDASAMRTIDTGTTGAAFDIPDVKGKNPTEAEATVYNYFPTGLGPEVDPKIYKSGTTATAEKGRLDLDTLYNHADYAIAYAQAYIHSPADVTVWGKIMADDVASVFINGKQASPIYKWNQTRWQFAFFPIALKAGENQVMVKCGDVTGAWYFDFGIEDPKGQLKFSAQPSSTSE